MNYSFIIPVYNCRPYLEECVQSIRAVGAEHYEILLIDDGSADGSGELCDVLAERYPEVRCVHQKNAGASAARNRGIREAQGERLLFVDSDDSLDASALGEILSDSRCSQTDLVIFGLTFDYFHGGKCYRRDALYYPEDGILSRRDWEREFRELFCCNSLSPVWNKVFRRDILIRDELWLREEMFLYEDLEFVLRYMKQCDRIWNVPEAVYHYRQSEDEGNAKRRLARVDSIPAMLAPIEQSLNEIGDVPEEQRRAVLLMLHQVLAREKIAGSDLKTVRKICTDYAQWCAARGFDDPESRFHRQLTNGKAAELRLQSKKTALRHWVAVRVKSILRSY